MEFWPKRKTPSESVPEPITQAAEEMPISNAPAPEREIHGDFDHISSPESFIKAVDFKVLNDIFDSLERKSGGAEKIRNSGHRIDPERISFTQGLIVGDDEIADTRGTARISTGEIKIGWDFEEVESLTPAESIDLLRTLTHESTHVRGGYKEGAWGPTNHGSEAMSSEFVGVVGLRKTQVNLIVPYDPQHSITKVRGETGLNINEAVTENIGQEVLREYLIRTGNNSYLRDPDVQRIIGSYTPERLALSAVIAVLADKLEVDPANLWQSLVQAYMSGSQPIINTFREIQEVLNADPDIRELMTALVSKVDMDEDYTFDELLDLIAKPREDTSLASLRLNVRAFKARAGLLRGLELGSAILANELGLRK